MRTVECDGRKFIWELVIVIALKYRAFKKGCDWLVVGQHIILVCLDGGYISGIKCHRT